MPITRAERLEPERVAEARKELGGAVVVEDAFDDGGAERGHALGEPRGHASAVQREIGMAGALHRYCYFPTSRLYFLSVSRS